MSLEKFNLVKYWAVLIVVMGSVATTAVAFYRLGEVEKIQTKVKADQEEDRKTVAELRSDVRVIREILERMDKGKS